MSAPAVLAELLPAHALLGVNAAATFFMVGLVWFVQVVHYPLFAAVGRQGFAAYELQHTRRTNRVVGPPMLVEAATAALLCLHVPAGVPREAAWAAAGLLALVWISTLTLQVPRHGQLAGGFDAAAHRALVATNWVRTAAWTARAGLVALMLARAAEAS